MGVGPLDGAGRVSFRTPLAVGVHHLVAHYGGDARYLPSDSSDFTQTVQCLKPAAPSGLVLDAVNLRAGGVFSLAWKAPPQFSGRYIILMFKGASGAFRPIGTSLSPAYAGVAPTDAALLTFAVQADPLCDPASVSDMSSSVEGHVASPLARANRGPIRQIPDLLSISILESSSVPAHVHTFDKADPRFLNRLTDPLAPAGADFTGSPQEAYDAFYSNADGSPNADGAFLTIEATYPGVFPAGGGLKVSRVDLHFADAHTERADSVASFVALGDNADPITVTNSVDEDPTTFTVLGNTAGQASGARLRLTLGIPPALPVTCPSVQVSSPPPPDGVAGRPYVLSPGRPFFFEASGGTPSYTFSLFPTRLPDGLHMLPGGLVYGAPERLGDFSLSLLVTDAARCTGSSSASIHVGCAGPITLLPAAFPLRAGAVGLDYAQQAFVVAGRHRSLHDRAWLEPASRPRVQPLAGRPDDSTGWQAHCAGRLRVQYLRHRRLRMHRFEAVLPARDGLASARAACLHFRQRDVLGEDPLHQVNYRITYSNNGTATASQVQLESLRDVRSFPTADTQAQGWTTAGSPIFHSLPDIAPGDEGSVDLTVRVADNNLQDPTTYQVRNLVKIEAGSPALVADQAFVLTAYCPLCTCPISYLTKLLCPPIGVYTDDYQTLSLHLESVKGRPDSKQFSEITDTERPPYTFAVSGLPPGLVIDSVNAKVTGTPSQEGSYLPVVGATDANGCQGGDQFNWYVCASNNAPVLLDTLLPDMSCSANLHEIYSQDLRSRCGTGPLTFSIVSGQLPPGMEITDLGFVVGRPTQAGDFTFGVQAKDATGVLSAVRSYFLHVAIACFDATFVPAFSRNGSSEGESRQAVRSSWLETAAHSVRAAVSRAAAIIHDIRLYYDVRDKILSATTGGRRYTDLYYRFAGEILPLIVSDSSLRSLAYDAMTAWEPQLQALVDGKGGTVALTPEMSTRMTALLEALKHKGSPSLAGAIAAEQSALNLASLVGKTMDQASGALANLKCGASETVLCLQGGRFRVETTWKKPDGTSGPGHASALTGDSGTFWFFDSSNVEMVVKTLNGCGVDQRYWVFAGGLTNVEVIMTVTDTQTGDVKTYLNPQGTAFAPILDTQAFATCSSAALLAGDPEAPSARTPRGRREAAQSPGAPCVPGATALCLEGGRFRVETAWTTADGQTGSGQAHALSGDSGYFWFFDPGNVEMLVKVLNGCSIDAKHWVFAGGLTNVRVVLTVTDTLNGVVRTYTNPAGRLVPANPGHVRVPGLPLSRGCRLRSGCAGKKRGGAPSFEDRRGAMTRKQGSLRSLLAFAFGLCLALAAAPVAAQCQGQPGGACPWGLTPYTVESAFIGNGTKGITAGPDGQIWFVNPNAAHAIGKIATAGPGSNGCQANRPPDTAIDPAVGCLPNSVFDPARAPAVQSATGPITTVGTNAWIAYSQTLVQWNPAGPVGGQAVNHYFPDAQPPPTPSPFHQIGSMAWDGSTAIWFTESVGGSSKIGRSDTGSGTVQEGVPPAGCAGFGGDMARTPDGNLWYPGNVSVCRIHPDGTITSVPVPLSTSDGLAVGPDGRIWVSSYTGSAHLQAFNPATCQAAGCVTVYDLPNPAHHMHGLTAGPDGRIWFVCENPDLVGSVKTDGTDFQYLSLPAPARVPRQIVAGPPGDNSVWFTESLANVIGRVTGLTPAPQTALLLQGGRFKVEVDWDVPPQGTSGQGTAIPIATDTGAFWFFSPNNLELMVKVLDGRAINGHWWVFYGALSNVEYTIKVTDLSTGTVVTYHNPYGTLGSAADTTAFSSSRRRSARRGPSRSAPRTSIPPTSSASSRSRRASSEPQRAKPRAPRTRSRSVSRPLASRSRSPGVCLRRARAASARQRP